MGRIFGVVNQKGGVGKTTTVINVAACLADEGKRVLVADLDPQGNATSGLGIEKSRIGMCADSPALSTYDLLVNGAPLAEAACQTAIPNLWLVPATLDLAGAEVELMPRIAREATLRAALDNARESYDFVLIDAPPSLGLLTVNALVAADAVIIPIQCEYFALEGVSQLMKTIDLVRRQVNPGLEIGMVILTMYDNRIRLNQQVVAEVRKVFGERVAKRVVPRNARIAEAPSHGLPVTRYDARSRGAQAYRDLAQEVMRIG